MNKEQCIEELIKKLKNTDEEDVVCIYEFVEGYLEKKS